MAKTIKSISLQEFVKKWAPKGRGKGAAFCSDLGAAVSFIASRHDRLGINAAVAVASEYDRLSAHPWRVSDCILGKLGLLPKSKVRRTPKPRN